MRGICFSILAIAFTTLIAAPSAGQQGKAGTPPPPPVTQGKTGQAIQGQGIPTQSGFNPVFGQTPWFSQPAAQQQLKLTPEQFNQLNAAYSQSWAQFNQGITGLGTVSEQQRLAQMGQLQTTFTGQIGKSAQGVLTPEQLPRFNQLNLQYQGWDVFGNPVINQQLTLAPEQMAKMREISGAQQQKLAEIQGQYKTDPQAAAQQYQAWRSQNDQLLSTTLSPQQMQAWRQMTGDPFPFTPEWMQVKK